MAIVRNKTQLRAVSDPVTTLEEGHAIANKLILAIQQRGLEWVNSLSAPNIGIYKRVFIIRKRDGEFSIYINPEVVLLGSERITYVETDASFPGKISSTWRRQCITIRTLNHANDITYGPNTLPITKESVLSDDGILESALIQHEIDHLNGILMMDKEVQYDTTVRGLTHKNGRNEIVIIQNAGVLKQLKYKHALPLIESGEWKLI